jgi:hypothetical protein
MCGVSGVKLLVSDVIRCRSSKTYSLFVKGVLFRLASFKQEPGEQSNQSSKTEYTTNNSSSNSSGI